MILHALDYPGATGEFNKQSEDSDNDIKLEIPGVLKEGKIVETEKEQMTHHLRETLRLGPVTKFSGLNVVKMLGEEY